MSETITMVTSLSGRYQNKLNNSPKNQSSTPARHVRGDYGTPVNRKAIQVLFPQIIPAYA